MRKRKVTRQNGKVIDGSIIEITSSQENWNHYLLEDGTAIKVKAVATEVVRVDGEYDNEGNPIYMIKTANIISINPSENLKKPI